MSAAESARPPARRCVSPSRRSRLQIDRACDDRTPSNESEFFVLPPLFLLLLIENSSDEIRRHRVKMRRLHRVTRASFRQRTNRSRVTEQLRERNLSVNDRQVSTRLDAVHLAPAPVQIADDVALIFFWSDIFNFHDWLEQDRFARSETVFHREDRGHFERKLARIDFVETSEDNVAFN